MSTEKPIALEVVSVDKSFGSVHALSDVSMRFRRGVVTALLGENGAGKSTMIRVCSGVHQPDRGEILVAGSPVRLAGSLAAKAMGIAVVHQEPQLVTQMTVAENIFLARLGSRAGSALHRGGALVGEAKALLASLGLENDLPDLGGRCTGLSAAERQLVEIARALAADPHVLFLDEPNSSLTRKETDRLFDIVRRLRDRGTAVVLVSHRRMPLAGASSLTWAQLQDEPLVRISAETGNRILLDDALGARRETLSWRYEVQRVVTAVSLVRSGIGYAIVPQLALDVVDAGDLVAVPLRSPSVTRTLGIITRKTVPLRAPARDLLSLLSQALKRSVAPRRDESK